jgi:hypothetical protein
MTQRHILNAKQRAERLLESWNPPFKPSSRSSSSTKTPPVVLLRAIQYVPLNNDITTTTTTTTKANNRYDHCSPPSRSCSFSAIDPSDSGSSNSSIRPRLYFRSRSNSHTQNTQGRQPICTIDVARHRQMLGWEDVDPNFVQTVLNIPGHHYSIFEDENVSSLSLSLALPVLISLSSPSLPSFHVWSFLSACH